MANPDDDLRGAIEGAFEEPAVEQTEQVGETEAQAAERARDEKGRFAPAPETPAVDPAAPVVDPAAEVSEPAPVVPVKRAPGSWKSDVQAEFDKLPPHVQDEVLRREADYHKGVEQLKPNATVGKAFQQVVQPYMQTIQQLGVDAPTAAAKLFQADHILRYSDPATKAQFFGQMAKDYGINLEQVANPPQVDPHIAAIQAQFQQQQAEFNGWKQQQMVQQQTVMQSEIQKFASDPAHTHFEAVKDDMARLLESGMAADLNDAYDKAVWGRSDTRQSLIEQQRAEAQKTATTQAQAQRAKAASVGVRGSSPLATGIQPAKGSLRDELSAAFDEA